MLPYRPAYDQSPSTPALPASAGCGCYDLVLSARPCPRGHGHWRVPLWYVAGPRPTAAGSAWAVGIAGGRPWCSACHTAPIRALSRQQTLHPMIDRRPELRRAVRVVLQGPWRTPTILPPHRRCEGRMRGGSSRGTDARLCPTPTPLCGSDPMAL